MIKVRCMVLLAAAAISAYFSFLGLDLVSVLFPGHLGYDRGTLALVTGVKDVVYALVMALFLALSVLGLMMFDQKFVAKLKGRRNATGLALLRVGDRVTSKSWGGKTAVIVEIKPYAFIDGADGTCAILNDGGFWRLSDLVKA